MKYTHNYSKLQNDEYTTIRRSNHGYKTGDIITETYPNGKHKAQIVFIWKETLDNLNITFLSKDTDCKTRKEIYELFQSFYPKPIDFKKEKFYIYHLKKVW